MFDESTLGVPFLTGTLLFVYLFIAWYRRVDPLVSLYLSLDVNIRFNFHS